MLSKYIKVTQKHRILSNFVETYNSHPLNLYNFPNKTTTALPAKYK